MDARQLRYRAEYAFFLGVLFVLRCLPVSSANRFADALAWFLHRMLPRKWTRYKVSAENIRTAFGDELGDEQIDEMVHGMWQHLARLMVEIIQIERRFRLANTTKILDFHQREECVKALLTGRPVIFLSGHFGNWEISVNTMGHFQFPMGVVARDLDNPWLHRWFLNFRESTGNAMISKRGASTELVACLETGRNVSLLADQDAGRRGQFVDFFGRPASTFKSIALLALQYDALIVVGGSWRLPPSRQQDTHWVRFEMVTEDVIDSRDFDTADAIPQLTQAFTSSLERLICRAPQQYFWVHRRWKTPPRVRKAKAAKHAA
ncbi:MAG: lysophospholipid acyltransferase family protein [Planctomycetaceae bacterium]|nr:lysophospholipid acyltransferase family protein [Planctomycetaceae bacterium]